MPRFLFLVAALLVSMSAAAQWPLPPDAPPQAHADAGSWPSDPKYAEQHWLWSHASDGASFDRAYGVTRGEPSTVIAVVGAGVLWDSKDLANKWALSSGELPVPEVSLDGGHDVNGDGRFNAQDYASATGLSLPTPSNVNDTRLSSRADKGDVNGNGIIDPQDLLAVFADGVDGDGNGLIDDVCGYDFAANDPDAAATTMIHDTVDAEIAAAQTNDDNGYAGGCPECLVIPYRVSSADLSAAPKVERALVAAAQTARIALVTTHVPGITTNFRAPAPLLIIHAPAVRPGRRLEPLDALPNALRADPLSATTAVPTPFRTTLLTPPAENSAAVLAGAAGLVISAKPALSASQAKALLLATARNGRLDVRGALDAIAADVPTVGINAPEALAHLEVAPLTVNAAASNSAQLVFEAAPGGAPDTFTEFARATGGGEFSVDPRSLAFAPPLLHEDPYANAMTVRVRATATLPDAGSLFAEARETVFLRFDRDIRPAFPMKIDGAGFVAPKLFDVNGDGSDDLIIVDAVGTVHALDSNGRAVAGFPVHLDAGSIFAPPAIDDFNRDGIAEIAVATASGMLTVIDGAGRTLSGFPRWVDGADAGVELYAAPVIIPSEFGSLIIQGDSTGHLHVFVEDGSELAGSPATVGAINSPIVATPAVSDVDSDGAPDIIVGTAELDPAVTQSKLHRLHISPSGLASVGDFNVSLEVAQSSGLRLQRRGVVASPIIGNLDRLGDREIVVRATGSALKVLRYDGVEVAELSDSKAQDVPSTGAIADLNGDGPFEIIDNEDGALKAWAAGKNLQATGGNPGIGAAALLTNYPMAEPAPALSGFVVGDVDGDREADLVFTSEDPLVNAISSTGAPIDGWPKQLPGGSNAHVAMGVMGNRLVVAALTRDGRAYVWNVFGTPRDIQWDSFQHDPANTGSTGTPLPVRALDGIGERQVPPPPDSCCSTTPSHVSLVGLCLLLGALKLARVRRED